MNISKQRATKLESILYACYTDGGGPHCLMQHAMVGLEITIENKPITLDCNWRDHVPGGRIYEQDQEKPPQ
jgi:hypothetical protein